MARNFAGYRVAALDSETDPFSDDMAERGQFGRPFTMGFYNGETYHSTWGENCVPEMLEYLDALEEPHLIYVHNGGRFDFHFLWDYIEEPLFIIDARLVEFGRGKARIPGRTKPHQKHVFRDSVSIIPIPLAAYKKDDVDYGTFVPDRRERHRAEIERYQRMDCEYLWQLCNAFVAQFRYDMRGKNAWTVPLTVGQAAMREFEAHHEYEPLTMRGDTRMRPYYFGGRVQCFASGIKKGPWRVYDVNSSYPAAMAKFCHPISAGYVVDTKPPTMAQLRKYNPERSVWFAEITASNRQGLPSHVDEATDFTVGEGRFFACSHELVPAILSGRVQVHEWHSIQYPMEKRRFAAFVRHWYQRKVDAKLRGDKIAELFAKFMLNSCYGKFGTDPRDFRDWKLTRGRHAATQLERAGWRGENILSEDPWLQLMSIETAVFDHQFFNVAIAASITSASRSLLMDGLRKAVEPVYCDTDSVICREFHGTVSETEIGAWKFEKEADYIAIAGKKTYCLFDLSRTKPDKDHGKYRGQWIIPAKWASKGGQLPPRDIIEIAEGAELFRRNQAPTYSTKRKPGYITRTFRQTVGDDVLPFEHGEHSLH